MSQYLRKAIIAFKKQKKTEEQSHTVEAESP